jgi:nonsense-mediated mRNA decay protein 3
MEAVQEQPLPAICCVCGIGIAPNAANMCARCICAEVDLTASLPKQCSISWCKSCNRYQRPPWVAAELESPELLALCLAKIKGMSKSIKLVDAHWVWTEPHSRRLKIRVTARGEALAGVIVEQSFTIEFVVMPLQCEDCTALATEHGVWKALVQVRQKVRHQRTFLFLEQLLLKHGLTNAIQRVVSMPGGLDLYFGGRSASAQLIQLTESLAPVRVKHSKRLISQDFHSNIANYKYTTFVDIAPICRFDLIFVPKKLRTQLGGIRSFQLVLKICGFIRMINAEGEVFKTTDLDEATYWRNAGSLLPLCTVEDLIEFVVLDIELCVSR